MKLFVASSLLTLGAALALSTSAFASKGAPLCDKNPSAPQCVQSKPKIPPSLPQRYAITSLVEHAQAAFTAQTGEAAGEYNCVYKNSRTVAYQCAFTSAAGRVCRVSLLQIWSSADYQVDCQGGISIRNMVNPGPVPETMD